MRKSIVSGLGFGLLVVAMAACSSEDSAKDGDGDSGTGGGSSSGGAAATGGAGSGGRAATGGGAATGGAATGGAAAGGADAGTDGATDGATTDGATTDGATIDGATIDGSLGTARIKFCHDIVADSADGGSADVTFRLTVGDETFDVITGACSPSGATPCLEVPTGTDVAVSLVDLDGGAPLDSATIDILSGEHLVFFVNVGTGAPRIDVDALADGASCTAYDASDIPQALVLSTQSVGSSSGYSKR